MEPFRTQPPASGYCETLLAKTKIIATVGPACGEESQLRQLVQSGVDVFRLNFAHGQHAWLEGVVAAIRRVSAETMRPIGILGDLSGPKIRLGILPEAGLQCLLGARIDFVRKTDGAKLNELTCTYDPLIDDLAVGDRVLLADGTVALRVIDKPAGGERAVCTVEQPGTIRSKQGVNLPGVALSTPAVTPKDLADLDWALRTGLDFIGLSFVRKAEDIRLLRREIQQRKPAFEPDIVAKIEKYEAIAELDAILAETDAVMVARGDLGVEVDIARVPVLQKQIIRRCNEERIPVITATQMLDSMQRNELPTRAEASDVANAVLDGTDAVMLSGETAVGVNPPAAVAMMSRIVREIEPLIQPRPLDGSHGTPRTRARVFTEAVTIGAGAAAARLPADLIVVATHSGRTAMALSKQRGQTPLLALTDSPQTARRMCLFWGVTSRQTSAVTRAPQELLKYAVEWGRRENILKSGQRLVVVGSTDWSAEGHDIMLVHVIP